MPWLAIYWLILPFLFSVLLVSYQKRVKESSGAQICRALWSGHGRVILGNTKKPQNIKQMQQLWC
jgi:hypothetical protein